jgi:yeast amino acid transporter
MENVRHDYSTMEMNQYQGMEVHSYGGMEINSYPGNGSDDESEKRAFHATANIYEEDPRSRLHRGLKTRQISMIALGGALGTGLLINT